jgi:hypothetical protein
LIRPSIWRDGELLLLLSVVPRLSGIFAAAFFMTGVARPLLLTPLLDAL